MKGIIDRFEGDYAVIELEKGEMKNILRSQLPDNVKEGDVLLFEGGKVTVDIESTGKRKNITDIMKELIE